MGIPNNNDFILALDVMKDRFRRNPIGPGAAGVTKEILIPAVMEIVGLKILEMMAFVKCLKKTCTKGHISIHGASAVHEKQQFGLVLAGLFHDNFQLTALFRRCGNGLLHIQFRSWSLFPIGEASQPAQGNLELADPKHMIITEITEKSKLVESTMQENEVLQTEQQEAINRTEEIFGEIMKQIEMLGSGMERINALNDTMSANKDLVVDKMGTIASVSEQSAAATEEVNASTEQVNVTMEEISEHTETLQAIAKDLMETINRFKLA